MTKPEAPLRRLRVVRSRRDAGLRPSPPSGRSISRAPRSGGGSVGVPVAKPRRDRSSGGSPGSGSRGKPQTSRSGTVGARRSASKTAPVARATTDDEPAPEPEPEETQTRETPKAYARSDPVARDEPRSRRTPRSHEQDARHETGAGPIEHSFSFARSRGAFFRETRTF